MRITNENLRKRRGRVWKAAGATLAIGAALYSVSAEALPTFARQTGWSCATCHTSYPQLTPMGRMFKLLGYTTYNVQRQQKVEAKLGKSVGLLLMRLSQFSVFVQGAYTNVNGAPVNSRSNTVKFPEQLSLFYSGEITPHIGTFMHITYNGTSGGMAFDDSSIVWSHPWSVGSNKMLITAVDVNNTPSQTDIYNTSPDWVAPFYNPDATPGGPSTFIQQAAGAGLPLVGVGTYEAYLFGPNKANWIYFEADAYAAGYGTGSNPNAGYIPGPTPPTDSQTDSPTYNGTGPYGTGPLAGAGNFPYGAGRLSGVAPYVRLAYQHDWGNWNWEVGTFGMWSRVYDAPGDIKTGQTDRFADYDLDTQLQWLDIANNNNLTVHASWIHEDQTFAPGTALSSASSGHLNSLNVNAEYWYHDHYGAEAGYQNVWGSANPGLYGTGSMISANGSPDTTDEWVEASYLPWWNTRFAIRYTIFNKYQGLGGNSPVGTYDASAFNTLQLLAWLAF